MGNTIEQVGMISLALFAVFGILKIYTDYKLCNGLY